MEKPADIIQEEPKDLKPILPRVMNWNVRRQMLEAEDRKKAQILSQQKISTEELEKELLTVEKEREG